MPSKEEIEQYKIRLANHIKTNVENLSKSFTSLYEQEILLATNNDLEGALKLIEQLEAEKQEIINYLKEEIDTMGSGKGMFLVKTALKAVLEKIMKGE